MPEKRRIVEKLLAQYRIVSSDVVRSVYEMPKIWRMRGRIISLRETENLAARDLLIGQN